MAYQTSELYKNNIYKEDSKQEIDIIINNNIVDKDYVKSIKFKDDVFENNCFSLGSTIASQYEIELNSEFKNDITDFNEIEMSYHLIIDDNTTETIPLGNYIVKTKDESSKDYTKLKLYDYMDKLDDSFDASNLVPCTRYELLKAICDYYGLELYNTSIVNGNILVNSYNNTLKAKNYVSFIAERAGGYAKVIRNQMKIINFADTDIVELPNTINGDYNTNDLKTITKIIYENGIQKFEKGTDDGEVIYLSQDSPFSCTQEEVDNIYDKLNGLQFQTLEVKIWGDPSIDTGDRVKLNNIISFCQKEWQWGNGFYGNYKTVLNKTDKMSNVDKISNNEKIKIVKSTIDELTGTVKINSTNIQKNISQIADLNIKADGISGRVEEVNKNLENNYYKNSKVEELVLNASTGVTNTFSEAGGNNILRNTNFSAKEVIEEGQNYEFWYGNVLRESNNNSTNGYSILLQNNILYQEQIIANGNYTLSFYYKKTNPLASIYVRINSKQYELKDANIFTLFQTGIKDEDGNYITEPIIISDNHLKIEFITDINNSCEIYDIMCNAGSVKLAYSQNSNETATDTVNISKGITITSSTSEVKFTANNDGIRTKNLNDDVITEFTDKGMNTNQATIKNEAIIVGLLRQRVGNQIWDSLI